MVFCLEVLEHLPEIELSSALDQISELLKPEATAVIGVPVEIGLPAAYKGLYRMTRRFGAFDANIKNIICAIFGRPPLERPIKEIAPGFKFHSAHMGFDHRLLRKK